jgi:NAD-dependent dihydropyrimidine dehydrogenase PreA subunit
MEIIIIKEKCVGCRSCIDLCPADEPVLELVDNIAVVAHLEHCRECQACAVNCEYGAVIYKD